MPRADTACRSGDAPDGVLFQYESNDVHEYGASLACWSLVYDQLSPGAFRGSLSGIRLSRVEMFREVTTRRTRQCGTLGPDTFTIGIPWAETAMAHCNGACIAGPDTFLVSHDAEIELFTPEHFEVWGVSTSARTLEGLAAALGLEWPRHYQRRMLGLRARAQGLNRLKSLLVLARETTRARRDLGRETPAARALEDGLLTEVLNLAVASEPLGLSPRARKQTVDRARDLMLSLDGKPMTLLDVCREVGASPRKLAYCFRDQLGVSPGNYWKVIRLNRARKDLLAGAAQGTDIYTVAARHGFWHFSQFSQDYKRHFVERPSETVRRARLASPR
ncbi:MAG: helix-turn-helix domain-containing protein [Hyphomicrobiaceae bacterium]|nr:helix-turn-helix domain-containing protein [Hyphomicrobiaceae bacterium]